MEATAILTIFCQAESYIFSLLLPTESSLPSPSAQQIYVPSVVGGTTILETPLREQLDHEISATVKVLRQPHTSRGKGHQANAKPLEELGGFLFNYLLPLPLQGALRSLPDELPIILSSNDHSLPWELLHDGTEFLALKHPIGRLRWGMTLVRPLASQDRRSLLLISNPTEDLSQADIESDELMDHVFDPELTNIYPDLLARSRATKFKVLQALSSNVDIIHYSGHAKPGTLLLADGELSTEEIQKTLSGHPFVFLNACWSVREAKQADESDIGPSTLRQAQGIASSGDGLFVPRDFAEAFISAGAIGFIGTLWPVFDHSSREFAEWFYTHSKNGMPVGEALRQTRRKMREQWPDDPIWASFVFYGDPRFNLLPAPLKIETRHVTVLVARLEGLFPLFDRLGLEQAGQIVNDVTDLLKAVSEIYYGNFYVLWDGLLKIEFGLPVAHDRAPELAIHAALNMIGTLHAFNQQPPARPPADPSTGSGHRSLRAALRIQVGISTKRVLVRQWATDHQGHQADYDITGQVEEIANHLMSQASSNQVMVDEATYRLTNDRFIFQPFIFQPFEPFTGAQEQPLAQIKAYRVVEVAVNPNAAMASTIVGRESQLNDLQRQWGKAKRGRGRVIAISGPPGIGKTSLIQAFQQGMQEEPHQWISVQGSEHRKQPLLAQVICQVAQIDEHDEQNVRQAKIREWLSESVRRQTEGDEGLALLGDMVGAPFALPIVDNLAPDLRQKKLANLVGDLLTSQSAKQAMVLVLEDLQWADEASLVVLDPLLRRVKPMRLLLLTVYRSNWEWPQNKWDQKVKLEELEEEARTILLTNLLGAAPSPSLDELISKQSGGHPLFVKEYIRLLQENDSLTHSANGQIYVSDMSQIPLPTKVEQVIQTRFDQLPASSRQILLNASIIGHQFEEEILQEIQDKVAKESLEHDLDLLCERKMIELLGGTPFFYTFSHGLVHEIVIRVLPEPLQRTTHGLVAQALTKVYGDKADIYRLAHHYHHSHDRINAIRYGLQVAKREAETWANQAALSWYERVLSKIQSVDASQERAEKEQITPAQILQWHVEALSGQADVQTTIGRTDDAISGYKQALALASEAFSAFSVIDRADLYYQLAMAYQNKGQFDLAQEALNTGLDTLGGLPCLEAGRIHIYTGLIHYRHGRLATGLLSCEQAIAIIEQTDSMPDLAQAYNLQGIIYRNLGESQNAIEAHKQSIALYEQAKHLVGLGRASSNLGCVYQDLGLWEQALTYFQESANLSQKIGDERRRGATANDLGEIYRRQGKLDQAIEAYEEARQIFEASGFEQFLGIALMNLGACSIKKGSFIEAASYLEPSRSIFERLNAKVHLPEVLCYLAELHLINERPNDALTVAQEALELALDSKRRRQEGEARRAVGQAYRALGALEKAEAELEKSLSILEECNSPYEAGLTLVQLALLRQAQAFASNERQARLEQAQAACERAMAIFHKLGAKLDLKRAQEIKNDLSSR